MERYQRIHVPFQTAAGKFASFKLLNFSVTVAEIFFCEPACYPAINIDDKEEPRILERQRAHHDIRSARWGGRCGDAHKRRSGQQVQLSILLPKVSAPRGKKSSGHGVPGRVFSGAARAFGAQLLSSKHRGGPVLLWLPTTCTTTRRTTLI